MVKKSCPTEDAEEEAFSDYCKKRGFTHWHVPQETYTNSWAQKCHNKALGVLKGVSDHWVILPTPAAPNGSLLVIEFKRQFGNTPTDEQIVFLDDLDQVNNVATVCCYGCDEAIKVVEELEKGCFATFDFCKERTEKIKKKRAEKEKNCLETWKKRQKNMGKHVDKNCLPY